MFYSKKIAFDSNQWKPEKEIAIGLLLKLVE